ncbi:hypothetical protein BBJ28_00011882 [Nothophytophthora sp. Chile5]|nr:hypothetical protein BBJ28_00011882 [Nothophytophthora sp. Chile5]
MPPETCRSEIKIHIRQHQPQDWPRVAEMYVDMLKLKGDTEEHRRLWDERVRLDTQENLLDITASHNASGGNLWVATTEDVVVGMVALLPSGDEGSGQVRRMYIDRKYHRLGIGRLLVTQLEQWAKANGFHRLFLTTDATSTQAAGFYTSLGFHRREESLLLWEDPPYFPVVMFTKPLL